MPEWRVSDGRPRAGRHYPGSATQFEAWFPSDREALAYLEDVRFRGGAICPRCENEAASRRDGRWWCSGCRRWFTVTSGTLLEHSRVGAKAWLTTAWMMVNSKTGLSAMTLHRELGTHYNTAWHLLHKIRMGAMDQTRRRSQLSGDVEVDETFVGGPEPGRPGRSRSRKQMVVIAVESTSHGAGRLRARRVLDATAVCLGEFIETHIEPNSTLLTDGLSSYRTAIDDAASRGTHYLHKPTALSSAPGQAHDHLPHVHRVASLLKRWLLGTHQGAVAAPHLDAYLNEFVFRFNRRSSRSRGLLFWRLVCELVAAEPYRRTATTRRRSQQRTDDEQTRKLVLDNAARRNREAAARSRARNKPAGQKPDDPPF